MTAPVIRRLTIDRFRGIKELSWCPGSGVNIILGGGDVGKTTVLDGIGLLLNPSGYAVISDADYHGRDLASGFRIEAVMSLPPSTGVDRQAKAAWVWEWDGKDAVVPTIDADDGTPSGVPVYRLRVEGTDELDLLHHIVQPDGSVDVLSAPLRRSIGLLRLAGDGQNDRDLRLVHGSVLDRLISDRGLRARMTRELASRAIEGELREEAKEALDALESAFKAKALPSDLGLAVTGSQGASVGAMIGLTAKRGSVSLPLASWGAGTRRISALAIAEQTQGRMPVTLVDEIERGLEPYRQRVLMEDLARRDCQVFLTTHSPAVISAAEEGKLWHLDASSRIGPLRGKAVTAQRKREPEAFLARLTIVAEGATEVGFVRYLLERKLGIALEHYGICVTDGGGQEQSLALLGGLARAGVRFAGFLDTERDREHPGQWRAIEEQLSDLVFRWKFGCTEENVIAVVPDAELKKLVADPDGDKTGERLRTLAERLGETAKTFSHISAIAGNELRTLIIEAATGRIPASIEGEKRKGFGKHGQHWFKSISGGHELAVKLSNLDEQAAKPVMDEVQPFLQVVLERARGFQEGESVKE